MRSFTESGVQMVAQGVTHQDSKPLVRELHVVLFHRLSQYRETRRKERVSGHTHLFLNRQKIIRFQLIQDVGLGMPLSLVKFLV